MNGSRGVSRARLYSSELENSPSSAALVNHLDNASCGDRYVSNTVAHVSELSHQDVDFRNRILDAYVAVHCPTKTLEKDHRDIRAVLTHCVQTVVTACTRQWRSFCANSCNG